MSRCTKPRCWIQKCFSFFALSDGHSYHSSRPWAADATGVCLSISTEKRRSPVVSGDSWEPKAAQQVCASAFESCQLGSPVNALRQHAGDFREKRHKNSRRTYSCWRPPGVAATASCAAAATRGRGRCGEHRPRGKGGAADNCLGASPPMAHQRRPKLLGACQTARKREAAPTLPRAPDRPKRPLPRREPLLADACAQLNPARASQQKRSSEAGLARRVGAPQRLGFWRAATQDIAGTTSVLLQHRLTSASANAMGGGTPRREAPTPLRGHACDHRRLQARSHDNGPCPRGKDLEVSLRFAYISRRPKDQGSKRCSKGTDTSCARHGRAHSNKASLAAKAQSVHTLRLRPPAPGKLQLRTALRTVFLFYPAHPGCPMCACCWCGRATNQTSDNWAYWA